MSLKIGVLDLSYLKNLQWPSSRKRYLGMRAYSIVEDVNLLYPFKLGFE